MRAESRAHTGLGLVDLEFRRRPPLVCTQPLAPPGAPPEPTAALREVRLAADLFNDEQGGYGRVKLHLKRLQRWHTKGGKRPKTLALDIGVLTPDAAAYVEAGGVFDTRDPTRIVLAAGPTRRGAGRSGRHDVARRGAV